MAKESSVSGEPYTLRGVRTVLRRGNLSYYSWRGADINNILKFETDWPGARVIKLEQNYRSAKNILDVANHVIDKNKTRKDKSLWTESSSVGVIELKEFNAARDEARAVAKKIESLVNLGEYNYSDFVILYRTNAQSTGFESEFKKKGIPYKTIGSISFFARAEIKDIIAYLSLINNKKDDVSFLRVVNNPKRSIGAQSISKLNELAGFLGISLFEAIDRLEDYPKISKQVVKKFKGFKEMIEVIGNLAEELPADEVISLILDMTGYGEMLEKDPKGEQKLKNIGELMEQAANFYEENREASLTDFLEQAALSSSTDTETEEGSVSLMTLHAVKGAEFPVVFLTGLEEGIFPSYQSIKAENKEEERRLFYVGITRAQEQLYISYARERMIYGELQFEEPSEFLDELELDVEREIPVGLFEDEDYKEQDFVEGERVIHKIFGLGIVNKIERNDMVILFPGVGMKRISRFDVSKM